MESLLLELGKSRTNTSDTNYFSLLFTRWNSFLQKQILFVLYLNRFYDQPTAGLASCDAEPLNVNFHLYNVIIISVVITVI